MVGGANAVLQSFHAQHEFDAAACTEHMAERTLRARDADLASRIAEYGFDRYRFRLVAKRGAGAVGVDVIDRVGVHFGVAKGTDHCPRGTGAFGIWLGDVATVGARA